MNRASLYTKTDCDHCFLGAHNIAVCGRLAVIRLADVMLICWQPQHVQLQLLLGKLGADAKCNGCIHALQCMKNSFPGILSFLSMKVTHGSKLLCALIDNLVS